MSQRVTVEASGRELRSVDSRAAQAPIAWGPLHPRRVADVWESGWGHIALPDDGTGGPGLSSTSRAHRLQGSHVFSRPATALLPIEVSVALRKATRCPRRSRNCAPWSRGHREGMLGLAAPHLLSWLATGEQRPPAPCSPVSGACPRLPLGCGRRLHGKLVNAWQGLIRGPLAPPSG